MKTSRIVGLCIAMALAGCSRPSPPASLLDDRIGQSCEVQFRRDALGAATPSGISQQTGTFNGMVMSMAGTLKKVQGEFILLTDEQSDFIVPLDAVLSIKFGTKTPPGMGQGMM